MRAEPCPARRASTPAPRPAPPRPIKLRWGKNCPIEQPLPQVSNGLWRPAQGLPSLFKLSISEEKAGRRDAVP